MGNPQSDIKLLDSTSILMEPELTQGRPYSPSSCRSKVQIVEDLARKQVLEKIIRKEVGEWRFEYNDLSQDLYLDLLEKEPEKLEELVRTGKLRAFLIQMVKNNIHSNSSRFYYLYRKFARSNNGEESKEYREAPWED